MTGPASAYERSSKPQDLLLRAGELSARTIIFDMEPLVAFWDSSQESLDQGVTAVLDQSSTIPGVEAVCFATNSARRPSRVPARSGMHFMYLASARKPIRTAPYRSLPRPGVVIGDQPIRPRLMHYCGRLVLPFLTHSRAPRADNHGGAA